MPQVKSRRELYSEATRAALLDEATTLFAERGYAGTSLEDVASASQVTRGAVYHHFAGKQALFEAVLDRHEGRATAEIAAAAATATDPWDAAMLALDAFLTQCCDPTYGRLVWLEGPAALGWHRRPGLNLAEAPEEENRGCVTNGATSSAGRSPASGRLDFEHALSHSVVVMSTSTLPKTRTGEGGPVPELSRRHRIVILAICCASLLSTVAERLVAR
jgi:AcrR family transcriptional regulator